MSQRPHSTVSLHRVLLVVLLGVGCSVPGCRSPQEHRADADIEVYEVIERRRAELGLGGGFTIEPPVESLRRRILEEAAEVAPLMLVDCLEIAAENSREYQRRKEQLYLAALDLTLERWRFQIQETGTLGAFLGGSGREAQTGEVSGGLRLTRLLGTGALIVGNLGIDLARALSTGDGWDAISSSSLTITQPLLRGFGRSIVLEPLTQAERDVLYEVRSFERFRRTFAFDVAERVFRVAQQVDTLRNEELNFQSLVDIRLRNEAFAEAGQLNDIQVDQARQDELRARNRVVDAERNLEAGLDDFKLFLGLPVETRISIDQGGLEGLFGLEIPADAIEEEVAAELALERRLDHRTVVDSVEDAERRVHVAADALRTGLDLTVTGSATSDEGRPADFSGSSTPWSTELSLDLPIDRLPERNSYRASLISLEAARRALEQSGDFVRADVRDALRELAAAREQLAIQENAVVLAERRVESTALNLQAGRADTRDILEAQEALVQAQNSATGARIDATLAGLALYRDMELLRVDEGGIRVETIPPPGEAPGEEGGGE